MNGTSFLVALGAVSIAAVALGLLAQRLPRIAATRHAILLASLLLPPVLALAAFLGVRLPASPAPVHGAINATIGPVMMARPVDDPLPTILFALWLAGTVLALARMAVLALRWKGIAERAEVITDPAILGRYGGDAVLARSREVTEPTVIGILDPLVVLPAAYELEPAELDAVFAHELAHIARRDNLTALAVQLVCAAFWFDPLHRIARRKLVELRERVCDDLVLQRGCDAHAYLTALARSCETSFHNPAVACMSRLNLQERMESIMTHDTRRRWPLPITRAFVAAAVTAIAIGFATFAPAPALLAGGSTAGGPDFDVRVTPHPDGRYTLAVRIDTPDGPFSSVAVMKSAPDTRTVSTTQGGRTYEVVVSVAADGDVRGTLAIKDGETIVAAYGRPFALQSMQPMALPPAPPRPAEDATPMPNAGNITHPRPVRTVEPLYPEDARKARVSGIAIIKASIDEQGNVVTVDIVKDLPYGLGRAAADAVSQWKFEPGRVDGTPATMQFNVTINFKLDS